MIWAKILKLLLWLSGEEAKDGSGRRLSPKVDDFARACESMKYVNSFSDFKEGAEN